ncbi:MAG: hypothetical protein IK048_05535 [Clostridia bacterium]|nr:hypothetical protein [Clostridia bacterium]
MSKKKRKQEVVLEPESNESVVFEEDQPLFEAEAYGSMQPEAGSDVTVVKQIGIGGPVPIVAPKHTTIQLQPIIVPLAVVPYMSQDSGILRTEGKQQSSADEYFEATDFSTPQEASKAKRTKKLHPRLLVLVSLILSAVLVLPFILAYFYKSIGMLHFDGADHFNVIGTIASWVESQSVSTEDLIRDILFIAAFASVGVTFVVELIALLAGKYPRAFSIVFAVLALGTSLGVLIMDVVDGNFVVGERVALVVFVALACLSLLLSIIFTVVLNRADDKAEGQKTTSEI